MCISECEREYWFGIMDYGNENGNNCVTNLIKICGRPISYLPNFYAPFSLIGMGLVIKKMMLKCITKRFAWPVSHILRLQCWWPSLQQVTTPLERTDIHTLNRNPLFNLWLLSKHLISNIQNLSSARYRGPMSCEPLILAAEPMVLDCAATFHWSFLWGNCSTQIYSVFASLNSNTGCLGVSLHSAESLTNHHSG